MSYPKTKDEWWKFVDDNWNNLKNIILSYYPNQDDFPEKGWPIRNDGHLAAPQQACNAIIKKLRKERPIWNCKGNFEEYLNSLKKSRNVELDRIFQSSWFGMPESPRVRTLPGFYIFCDLCSESYVLYEKDNKQNDKIQTQKKNN